MDVWNSRARCRIIASLLVTGISGPVQGQSVPLPGNPGPIGRLNEDVAYSLFLLTNGGFTSAGHVHYQDESTTSKINVYTLPLRLPLETGLLGPLELRLTAGYGEAKTTALQSLTGVAGNPAGVLAAERQFIELWNLRFDIGRPISLMPDLVLTPMIGIGIQHWSGKLDRTPLGGSPVPAERANFWTDALLTEAAAIIEYRYRWGALNIRPGACEVSVARPS
jgi:hypothetical protein